MITCTPTTVDSAFRARGEGTRDMGLPHSPGSDEGHQRPQIRQHRIPGAFPAMPPPGSTGVPKGNWTKTDCQGMCHWEADNNMRRGQEKASITRRSEAEWSRIGSHERIRNQLEACGARQALQRAGTAGPDSNGRRKKTEDAQRPGAAGEDEDARRPAAAGADEDARGLVDPPHGQELERRRVRERSSTSPGRQQNSPDTSESRPNCCSWRQKWGNYSRKLEGEAIHNFRREATKLMCLSQRKQKHQSELAALRTKGGR
jgi:hypothetical protein